MRKAASRYYEILCLALAWVNDFLLVMERCIEKYRFLIIYPQMQEMVILSSDILRILA